jgi:hypothetical protein
LLPKPDCFEPVACTVNGLGWQDIDWCDFEMTQF